MRVQRRRRLLALSTAGLLLIAGAYVWLWPQVRFARALSRVRIGMPRAEVQAVIGRPPDREYEHDGRPIEEVWKSGGEDFHVGYDRDSRVVAFWQKENAFEKVTRWVRELFNR